MWLLVVSVDKGPEGYVNVTGLDCFGIEQFHCFFAESFEETPCQPGDFVLLNEVAFQFLGAFASVRRFKVTHENVVVSQYTFDEILEHIKTEPTD